METFAKGMEKLLFARNTSNEFERENRNLGYDNDCSDDERDDSFYDEKSARFYDWAKPIVKNVYELAKASQLKIEVETSAEYGLINITIK